MGTYIAMRVAAETEKQIRRYILANHIPLVYPKAERRRHVTLFASADDFVEQYNKDNKDNKRLKKLEVLPLSLEVFPTKEGKRSLVLMLGSYTLHAKNNMIRKKYRAKDAYDEYKPHITISYDIGNFDETTLPGFHHKIALENEYCEPFREDWVSS